MSVKVLLLQMELDEALYRLLKHLLANLISKSICPGKKENLLSDIGHFIQYVPFQRVYIQTLFNAMMHLRYEDYCR